MKRKWFHRSWQIFLKYVPGLLIAGFISWGLVILYNEDNWLGISALATLFLALAAFLTIRSSNEREKHRREEELLKEKRDRKERLLKEIIDWVTDIQKGSLDVGIPVTGGLDPKSERKRMEANILLKYAIPFSKNEYIRAIARKGFKKELECDVENAINIFTAFLFLKGQSFGMENAKKPFRGTALKIIEEVEKQINEDKKTIDQLLTEYSEELSKSMNILLIKIGNVTASL